MSKAKVSWLLCIGRLVSKIDNAMHFARLIKQVSVDLVSQSICLLWRSESWCYIGGEFFIMEVRLFIIIMIPYPLLTSVQKCFQWIIWRFSSMPRCLSSAPWEEKGSETFQTCPVMFSRWSIISALRLTLCVCLNPLDPEWVILEAFSERKPIRHSWCVVPGSGGLHRGVGRDYVTDYRPCLCVVREYLTEVTHLTARRVETLFNTKDELFSIHCNIESCIFSLCLEDVIYTKQVKNAKTLLTSTEGCFVIISK